MPRKTELIAGARRKLIRVHFEPSPLAKKSGALFSAPDLFQCKMCRAALGRAYATRGARLRELRWKNSAWLATADTIAGWNGFEIRKAGSGRSPVRKRSG